MRHSADFAATIRGGARSSSRNLVVHARYDDPTSADPARVGFVVSRAVGPAVQRNKVRRRLRAAVAEILPGMAAGLQVVVRARPPARTAPYTQLRQDLHHHIHRAQQRSIPEVAQENFQVSDEN